jgi:hypothetical protein
MSTPIYRTFALALGMAEQELLLPSTVPSGRPRCSQTVLDFEAVASPEEIPNDSQLLENSVLIRFERDEMMEVDSPFFVAGAEKS